MEKDFKTQGKKNRASGQRFERDKFGRFVKGHNPLGSPKAMIEHNLKHGVWNKGLKLSPQSEETKMKKAKTMFKKHQNPSWNEELRRKKISEKLKGHKVSEETKQKLKRRGKKSKKQGTNFEYRAKNWLEQKEGVLEVLRSGGSRNIDLTVIWKKDNQYKITKEEVKSSLRWFKSYIKNPLTLLETYLICRKPKEKITGGYMSRQTEILRFQLELEDNKILMTKNKEWK